MARPEKLLGGAKNKAEEAAFIASIMSERRSISPVQYGAMAETLANTYEMDALRGLRELLTAPARKDDDFGKPGVVVRVLGHVHNMQHAFTRYGQEVPARIVDRCEEILAEARRRLHGDKPLEVDGEATVPADVEPGEYV